MRTTSRFFIAEHHALKAKLHYDLRFRIPKSSIWASFACRKKIPLVTGEKILAIRTKDHAQKDALFTGKIKTGYGAGTLKKWDSGSCIIERYTTKHIAINFKGSKMKGLYHLFSFKKPGGKDYFLFKGKEGK